MDNSSRIAELEAERELLMKQLGSTAGVPDALRESVKLRVGQIRARLSAIDSELQKIRKEEEG